MGLIHVYLGDSYTGDIQVDLKSYLEKFFKPVLWEPKDQQKILDAGKKILEEIHLFDQCVEMIAYENSFLQENPKMMVTYHAAENNVLQMYTFINLWRSLLSGKPINYDLPALDATRLYDFMQQSIDDIKVFLIKMRKRRSDSM